MHVNPFIDLSHSEQSYLDSWCGYPPSGHATLCFIILSFFFELSIIIILLCRERESNPHDLGSRDFKSPVYTSSTTPAYLMDDLHCTRRSDSAGFVWYRLSCYPEAPMSSYIHFCEPPEGFEPPTFGLQGRCSARLKLWGHYNLFRSITDSKLLIRLPSTIATPI